MGCTSSKLDNINENKKLNDEKSIEKYKIFFNDIFNKIKETDNQLFNKKDIDNFM